MDVLVIGGTRNVGRQLVFRLLGADHRVTLLNRGTLEDPFGARVTRLRADRTTAKLAQVLEGRAFDAVVDFAAYLEPDVQGVIAALGGRIGHYVFISTGQVYLVRDRCPTPSRESDYDGPTMREPPDAVDEWAYGMGKRACEDALIRAASFPSTRLRIPMVNGERDHLRRLEGYLWRILDGGPVILPDGGTQRLRHVYSGDVATAITGMLGASHTFGKAYNLAQDEMPTLADLCGTLFELCGAIPRLQTISSESIEGAGMLPKGISPFSARWMSCLDPGLARTELGFRHHTVRAYLEKIVASFLANVPATPPPGYATRAAERKLAERADRVTTRIATKRPSEYVHGASPVEQERLTRLNTLLNASSLGALALSPGERVLDVGSGLGQLARGMARVAGRGRVVGIERSEEQRAEALRQARAAGEEGLFELRAGDASAFPLEPHEWGSFDVCHTRFLLEHVPDPLAVVQQMVRATRPGGRIVLEDDDHALLRLWPEPPGVMRVWDAYVATYQRGGNDPYVGRRLVELLAQAGAHPSRCTWLFFGACSGETSFAAFVENLAEIFRGAAAAMLATGRIGQADLDEALASLLKFRERSDAAFWYAMAWAEGLR